jgi:hypothetical protein
VHWELVAGLKDFLSSLLLVTLGREVRKPKDCREDKGHTSLGVICARGMRDCGLVPTVGT